MKIKFNEFLCSEGDGVILPLFEDKLKTSSEDVNNILLHLKNTEKFQGKKGEVFTFNRICKDGKIQDIVVTGLGKEELVDNEIIRKSLGLACKEALLLKCKKVCVNIISNKQISQEDIVKSMVEGLGLAEYSFNKYKKDKKDNSIEFSLGTAENDQFNDKDIQKYIEEGKILVSCTCIARDLTNEPANVLYPETLVERVGRIGKESGFEVEVFDEKQIKVLKMDAFMSVAKGSDNPPRFIVMRYMGDDNSNNILGLVGKGLTYDAGGYSLKPTDGMVTMKSDMGGAAAVISVMSAIAKNNLKVNVIAVVAACENLISGHAYKPGDIIGSMAGKTIEVLNTDAEGRLTLVDAVNYIIDKEHVTEVIDVATLTGAAVVALGDKVTAVISNNDEFYNELEEASKITGEKFWRLPYFDEYKEQIKSDIADLKNLGGRYGGTITAGAFIGEFVQDKPWLHLDIAGTAYSSSESDYGVKGGTGTPVRTLYELIKDKQNI